MTVRGWRISFKEHANTMWSGVGAGRTGARWNSKGVRVCYASSNLSLAVLETLVHLKKLIGLREFVYASLDIDETFIERTEPSRLPPGWDDEPPGPSVAFGDAWAHKQRSVVLQVPSVILPSEHNYVLNPDKPDFNKLVLGKPQPFRFDPRLVL